MNGRQIDIIRDEDPYSRIPKALIQDDRLRLQTRMVLIMMLSCRPDWDFSIRGMAKIAGVTKDTMSKMMAELEVAGYVKRKPQAREFAGQFAKAGYLVSGKPIFLREPEAEPCHENQDTVEDMAPPCPNLSYTKEPYTINSPQINNKQVITKQVNNPPHIPPAGEVRRKERPGAGSVAARSLTNRSGLTHFGPSTPGRTTSRWPLPPGASSGRIERPAGRWRPGWSGPRSPANGSRTTGITSPWPLPGSTSGSGQTRGWTNPCSQLP